MSRGEVAVVRTGVANLASVLAAFGRLGRAVRPTADADAVVRAERVVLPGVGAFGAAMAALTRDGVADALRLRIRADRPTLAVCVGLQVLFETSAESPGVPGLGVVAGAVERFPASVRVPQLGWNRVEPDAACAHIHPGYAYFANSYRATRAPGDVRAAVADHGGAFVAGFERGALLALQCHPELSGRWGAALLERWLDAAEGPC